MESWRTQALIVPLCLAAQWEPVSCQQLYVALTVVDTSLGEARGLGDPVCCTSLQVGPAGWLSVPEGQHVSGGHWLFLEVPIRVFTPVGLTECRQACVFVCLHVAAHVCLGPAG